MVEDTGSKKRKNPSKRPKRLLLDNDNIPHVERKRRRQRSLTTKKNRQLDAIEHTLDRLHVYKAMSNETGLTRGELLFMINGYTLDQARCYLRADGKEVSTVNEYQKLLENLRDPLM